MFRFKHFTLEDDSSTLKMGTDAMLLGAWTEVEHAKKILDIGTGSGVLALMLAQKTNALITAIDIDKASIIQAKENFNKSDWNKQLSAILISLEDFTADKPNIYDLIICNPPYFENGIRSIKSKINLAKHQMEMNHESLISSAEKLLSDKGKISVIIPADHFDLFNSLAANYNFFLLRNTTVFPKPKKAPVRKLLSYGKFPDIIKSTQLIIRNTQGFYTRDYKMLTSDYHAEITDRMK